MTGINPLHLQILSTLTCEVGNGLVWASGDSMNASMAIMNMGFFALLAGWLIYRRIKKYQSYRRRLRK